MIKTKDFTKHENIDLMEEVSLVAPIDTPLTTYLLENGLYDETVSVIANWREKALDLDGDANIEEGADFDKFTKSKRVERNNVCEIFAKAVAVSGTAQASGIKGINDLLAEELEDRLVEVKVALEKAVVSGEKDMGDTTGIRKMQGLTNFVTKDNTISRAKLDEKAVKDTMKKLWENGSGGEVIGLVNADLKDEIDEIYKDKYFYQAEMNEFGIVVTKIQTNFGNIHLILNRHVPKDELILVDPQMLRLSFLREPQFEELGKTGDSHKGMVVTEATVKLLNEKSIAKFKMTATK